MKHSSKNEYWVDPITGKPRFEFNEMYKDLSDPWGCEEKNQSLTNRIFLEMLNDENSRYQRVIDLGSGKGSLTNLFYNKYIQIRSKNQGNRPTKQTNETDNFEMIGLEYSEIAVQESAKINPKIRFETFDLLKSEKIPYNEVDLVILSEVLWYLVTDLSLVFRKIHNCLISNEKGKGLLAIHQYFPGQQKFFKEYIDGESGFERFIWKEGLFTIKEKVKFFHQNDDSVLLYKLEKQ